MNVKRHKILIDKRRQTGVFVRLLFEPKASSSTWSRAEIYEQWLVLGFCFFQRLIGVFDP
jgi:hypothetical protein